MTEAEREQERAAWRGLDLPDEAYTKAAELARLMAEHDIGSEAEYMQVVRVGLMTVRAQVKMRAAMGDVLRALGVPPHLINAKAPDGDNASATDWRSKLPPEMRQYIRPSGEIGTYDPESDEGN